MKEKRAIILAGGRGTRLRPYTVVLPKPLMPIGDYPILEVVIRQLKSYGFTRITMAVNHQADIIKAFFGDGGKWGLSIDYSLEDKPLSTMAPLGLIKDLPDRFLVMNGDVLSDLDYGKLFDNHLPGDIFTISAFRRSQKVDFGVLHTDASDRLIGFEEKPENNYLVSMGVYVASKRVLEYIPSEKPYGFDDLMEDLIRNGEKINVKEYGGYWLDIGRPDDYSIAIDVFNERRSLFLNE